MTKMSKGQISRNSSTELRLPTLDERVSLYLRAVHGRRDFTNEERADARERILDAMADDISSKSEMNCPNGMGIFLTEPSISPSSIGIGQFDAPSAEQSEHRFSDNQTPSLPSALDKLSVLDPSRIGESNVAPRYISDAPEQSLAPPRIALNRRRTSSRRRFVLGISAIAAVMALFIVGALRTGWFKDSQNSLEPTVALQSPAELWKIVRPDQGGIQPPAELGKIVRLDQGGLQSPAELGKIYQGGIEDLLKRGREMAAAGNIRGARVMFNLGAEAGSAAAALELGGTYDPNILEHLAADMGPVQAGQPVKMQTNVGLVAATPADLQGKLQQYLNLVSREAEWSRRYGENHFATVNLRRQIRDTRVSILDELKRIADIAMARAWYQKAKDLGSPEAQGRLEKLEGR
jgi:hypothetical protein